MNTLDVEAPPRHYGGSIDSRGSAASSQEGLPKWIGALPSVLLVAYFVVLQLRFAYKGDLYLSFFTDDFFYYFLVAKNLALHSVSTFNGIQATNGYHPLWLVTMTLLFRVFGSHLSFFVAVLTIIWLLVCGSYRALRRTQSSISGAGGLNVACALLSITFMAVVSRTGMEVSLALFLLALFWERMAERPLEVQTPFAALASGLLASALILSRLDTCLIVAVYGALTLIRPLGPRQRVLTKLLWFSFGFLPIALYVAINEIEFGTLLPISGLAKNLRRNLLPSASTVATLGRPDLVNILFTWPSIVLCALFALHLLHKSGRSHNAPTQDRRRVQLCVLLHPVFFYTVLSFSSDWPLWTWYLYPLVPVAALLGPASLAHWRVSRRLPIQRAITAAVGIVSLTIVTNLARLNPAAVSIYQRALRLQAFAETKPGRYAMGDAAGTPAYLMSAPVVQLEGLTGDKAFLERIKRQEPLLEALRALGVDYYVSIAARPVRGCFDVREPAQAGPKSPVMRAHLCVQPLADFRSTGAADTLVFDVRNLPISANQPH